MNVKEIHIFNKLLEEFFDKMIIKFNSNYLIQYKRYFLNYTDNNFLPAELFYKNFKKYKMQINNRDEIFFTKNHFVGDLINNAFIKNTNLICYYWNGLDEISKNSIWEYIIVLFNMSEKIIKSQERKKNII